MSNGIYDVYGNEIIIDGTQALPEKNAEITIGSIRDTSKKRPYWILHLDCGRKFFSVANIKSIIDAMHTNGMNQLQLHFSENRGFRFSLNDMNIVTEDGTAYDLSPIVTTGTGGYLTQSNMDEIITYARTNGVEIVPSLDMPGHMNSILNAFPAFKYTSDSAWTLNVKNPTAVSFALAIIDKFANYFSARGCRFWNIGADEVVLVGAGGRWRNVPSEDIPYFIDFINKASEVVVKNGMIPRVFNDGILYGADYNNYINRNLDVYYWCSSGTEGDANIQSAETLRKNNFHLINTNKTWYFIIPSNNSAVSNPKVENANLLKSFVSGNLTYDQDGACICVWCDNDTTYDGGNAALSAILADIASFGIGIGLTLQSLDYPVVE